MSIRELKNKSRKTVGFVRNATGNYICEILNSKRGTVGYIKEIQTRTKYEIQSKSRSTLGYVEYFGQKLELKDRSRKVIAKLDSKLNITDDAVLLSIIESYFDEG
ncbi:MAG: hypothetical protein PHV68_00825 [Candidatus Gastranaerophilales bacterium]|nr:hypothetical protein [Candidatus Gastranaerophilales bacterium]